MIFDRSKEAPVAPKYLESVGPVDNGDGTVTVALVWPDKPICMNEFRTMHFRKWSHIVDGWREGFRKMAEGIAPLEWADVWIYHEVQRRQWPDGDACSPTAKAALDGAVLGGLLAGDSWPWIRGHHYMPTAYTLRYALTLEFVGPLRTMVGTDS